MNDKLKDFARSEILKGIAQCTTKQQLLFRKMHSPSNPNLPIKDIINKMDEDKLNLAMKQIEATLKKNKVINGETTT
jgi:hypothetical protein